ncbi:UU173 family protein [Mycoplasmopsis felis]|uniref:UU173 family protein n=1 Tax=Mycoplasmopsis felis TaxID=33923 RepID=UPI002DD44D6A|nr:DUF2779 domain-containing protein [Mycoplasmopsis felis]WRX06361.1 DUF2779 domain-containing protein [Mycoplasmopsis felis]
MKNNITWNVFKKVFSNNPALIWTPKNFVNLIQEEYFLKYKKENILSNDIDEENSDEALIDFEIFETLNNNSIHEINLEINDVSESYIKVAKDSYDRYLLDATRWYINKYGFNSNEIEYISSKSNWETRHIQTMNAFDKPNINLVVNGNLLWNQKEINYNAPFFIFDKKNSKLVLLSYTTRIKYEFFSKFFYYFNIFKKNNLIIKDMSVVLINPYTKILNKTKKNYIDFYEGFSSVYTKTISKSTSKKANENQILIDQCIKKTGDILLLKKHGYDKKSEYNFYNSIKRNQIPCFSISSDFEKCQTEMFDGDIFNLKWFLKIPKKTHNKEYYDFDYYIKIIEKSFTEFYENTNFGAIKYFASFDEESIIQEINNWLESNRFIYKVKSDNYYINESSSLNKEEKNELLKLFIGQNFEELSMSYFSNNEKNNLVSMENKMLIYKEIDNFFHIDALNILIKLHKKNARICWYDYEGFSDLYPPMNRIAPYNQLVNQVSVIITKNGIEESVENLVIDTKNISCKDLVKIIQTIYNNKPDYFVVYNKNYENTRNKEISKLVSYEFFNNKEFQTWFLTQYNNISDFTSIITYINNNTIDLADCFSHKKNLNIDIKNFISFYEKENLIKIKPNSLDFYNKNITYNKSLIHINFLKYFYSIKKIEKYITHMNFDLKTKITPYNELVIQKGTMAMEAAILRYLGATNDAVWNNNIVPELKKYCENDVRAMIMVYEFIMYLFRTKFKNINEYEYKLIEVENKKYTFIDDELFLETT